MSIQIRPAVLATIGVVVALLVGIRNPAWGFRLLLITVLLALALRIFGRRS